MSTFNPNSEKLAEFIKAYEAGASVSELAEIVGPKSNNRVSSLSWCLVRLGVVDKRPMAVSDDVRTARAAQMRAIPIETRRENLAKGRAALAAQRAEFRAWKAEKASRLAAE